MINYALFKKCDNRVGGGVYGITSYWKPVQILNGNQNFLFPVFG